MPHTSRQSPKNKPGDGDPKVRRHRSYSPTDLSDMIACMAANVENAYRTAGVTDYTAKECVDLAARVLLERFVSKFDIDEMTILSDTTPYGSEVE
jgi:hypothetical protein